MLLVLTHPRFIVTKNIMMTDEGRQWPPKEIIEQEERAAWLWASARAKNDELMKAGEENKIKHAEAMEKLRRDLDDLKSYGRYWKTFGYALGTAVLAGTVHKVYWPCEA